MPTHFRSVIHVFCEHPRMLLRLDNISESCAEKSLNDGPLKRHYAKKDPTISSTASLVRGKNPPNECHEYDSKQSDGDGQALDIWAIWSTPLLQLLPGPLSTGVVEPDRVLSIVQKELNCILLIKWIDWNRTVLTFKLRTYAKLNCLKYNCFDI